MHKPNRGGVEDTRLEAKNTKKSEAKAKDSLSEDRPSRGQGQECSRPRPRSKDTAASALQRKKDLLKSFSGNLQFIGVARIFDWGGLIHKLHAMTPSKIFLLALNQDFAKREGLNQTRSQDLEKGGLFCKSEKCANDLDSNFH